MPKLQKYKKLVNKLLGVDLWAVSRKRLALDFERALGALIGHVKPAPSDRARRSTTRPSGAPRRAPDKASRTIEDASRGERADAGATIPHLR